MDFAGFVKIVYNQNNEIGPLDKIGHFRIFVQLCPIKMDGHGHTPIRCVQLSSIMEELT